MRFTRLKLTNWRNFKNAEVRLAQRAFFVGPNASGKSNLLDAVRFLRDLASEGGGLATAVRDRGGVSAVRCLQATYRSHVEIEVDVGTDEDPAAWTYAIAFNARKGEQPLVHKETVLKSGMRLLARPEPATDGTDPPLLSQTHLQQVNQNRAFRPLVEFFQSTRYLHLVPQIIRNRIATGMAKDPYGSDFLLRVKQTPEKTRNAMLRRMNEALKLAVPQFDGLEYRDDDEGRPHLVAKYHHWRPHPAGQSEAHFSDGTLRLLGLLWAAGEKEPGPLLLEEPELSLQDGIVEQIVPLLYTMQKRSGRQLLVTTHSEVLINAPGIGLDEGHLLRTTEQGTEIITGASDAKVRAMVEAGMPLGAAIMPRARPKDIEQLSLFDVLKG